MRRHPSDQVLFELGREGEAEVLGHLAGCDQCRVRRARLAAGAVLLDAARQEPLPEIDWRAVDARVLAAIEAGAQEIRRKRLRSQRFGSMAAVAGVALAAAAAGVMMFASRPAPRPQVGMDTASETARPPRRVASRVAPDVDRTPQGASVQGVVLMVAAPVSYTPAGGQNATLTASTVVREGGRIAAGERGGRAVVSLHGGHRLDARPGARVVLAQLSPQGTTLALEQGEARIDSPPEPEVPLSVEAAGWTLKAKGGAFVAKIDGSVLRLRVMVGKLGVTYKGADERDVLAGQEVELAKEGGSLRVVSYAARDPGEIDVTFLSPTGRAFELLSLTGHVVDLRVAGRGALPAGLLALRTGEVVTLQAEVDGVTWSMVLDPAAPPGELPAWHKVDRSSGGGLGMAVAPRPAAVEPVPSGEPSSQTAPSDAPVAASAPIDAAVAMVPAAPPEEAGLRDRQRWEAERELLARVQQCLALCRAGGGCGEHPSGPISVSVDTNADGTVSDARVGALTPRETAVCIEREARALRLPSLLRGATVQLEIPQP